MPLTLNIAVSLEVRVVCVQCGKPMEMEGQKQMNPNPTLKCPDCGFKIRVERGAQLPGVQVPESRFPALKPKRF